jgi:surfeit locus 1 family protein
MRPTSRRRLWATLIALPMLAVLIGLGAWQLERREWKLALIAELETQLAAPPAPLPAVIDNPVAWNYRRVTARGRFDHAAELHVPARTYQSQAGWHVVTPLLRADGAAVLVDRGWVTDAAIDPASRPESLVAGEVEIGGILRVPTPPGWLIPDNRPEANQWYWLDLPAMAAAAGIDGPVLPLVLEAELGPPGALPIGGQTRVELPNDHLQYALTWFSLAAVLAVIFILSVRRRPPGTEAGAAC